MAFFKKVKKGFKKTAKKFKKSASQVVNGVGKTFVNLAEGDFKGAIIQATRAAVGASGPDLLGLNNSALKFSVKGFGVGDSGLTVNKKGAIVKQKDKSTPDIPFSDPVIAAEKAATEERLKRTRRRSNVISQPLGQLITQAKTTRQLTGQ